MHLQNIYDFIKLRVWKRYFEKNTSTTFCVFVSEWMRGEFYKWTKLEKKTLQDHEYITYNSVGEVFEKETWDKECIKKYDFITIRAYIDGSKYCVDIVNNLAKDNPNKRFLLVGQGNFFNHNDKASNLEWFDKRLNHSEMLDLLNKSKCALMPTRTDAQGVMMCEMAAFGMPVITSDIPVCHEVFSHTDQVGFIDNKDVSSCDLEAIYESIKTEARKDAKYFFSTVCEQEYSILCKIAKS